MTEYVAALGSSSSTSIALSVMPSSSYPIRIARIEVAGGGGAFNSSTSITYTVLVYPSSTVSGGTSITPYTMRQLPGVPACTATAKTGGTISGTAVQVHYEQNVASGTNVSVFCNLNSNYTFPFDLILSSGSTLQVSATVSSATIGAIAVYFEELHETWAV